MRRPPSSVVLGFVAALVGLASCLGGPPNAPLAGSLGPGPRGAAPRAQTGLAVVFAGPRGVVTDLEQPAVTVLFNHAAHDPDAADTDGLPALAVASEDGRLVAGAWQWVGTHGLLFTPDHPLPGSTRFVVTVAAGAKSLDGEALAADYRFEFTTARPAIARAEPSDGAANLRPDSTLHFEFNQPMDPSAVERAVRAVARDRSGAAQPVTFHAARATSGPAAERSVVLTPAAPLPLDRAIEVTFPKGLAGQGPLATTSPIEFGFRTYGPLRLADVRCPRATGPRCQAHRDFTMVLSNAVAPAEFKAHFKAADLPLRKPDPDEAKKERRPPPSAEQLVSADPDFGKRYHLKITAGMRDVFGQVLDRDIVVDVDTEAPYVAGGKPIDTQPSAPSDDSSTPAPTPDPQVPSPDDPRPHRPRLDYDLAIGLQGHVIEALARQGLKSHQIPIGAMNVPSYAMTAARLREEEALSWLDRAARDSGSDPSLWNWTWVNPGAPENVRAVRTVDLDALLGGPGARGAAFLAVAQPGSMSDPTATIVTVTDLAVSAKMSRYGGLVWVTRLSDGAPVEGAKVSVRKAGKPELFAATTDGAGLATIPVDRFDAVGQGGGIDGDAFLFVSKDDDWTYQKVERASASLRGPVDVDLEQRGAWAGMLYTDRGVYRPGESLALAGVFRRVDAAGIRVVAGEEARVLVTDAQGESVFDGRAALDAFGRVVMNVPLPKTSHLGEARITASLGRKNADTFEQPVLLAAYKASEFKVGVDPDRQDYVRGDTARFDVHAEYLFGAPMSSAPLHNHVSRAVTAFAPPHTEAFVTTDEANVLDHPETNPNAAELRVDDGALDDGGRYGTTVGLALPRMRGPEVVTFETEVEDLTHQAVARSASVVVHPAAFYLGLGRLASRFLAVGAQVPVKVAAFDPRGGPAAGALVKVELVKRTWTSVVEDENAAVARRRSKLVDTVVGACDVTTAPQPASCPLAVREPGYYILRARAKDDRGNEVGASTSFYSLDDRSDAPATPLAWADPDARGVKLETDKKQYEAGDVAKVLVRSPFKEADALVTVERAGVLWSKVVTLRGPMPVVEVPISAQYFPNAFVAVHLVRGRVQAPPAAGIDLGAPDFRIGIVPIQVDPDTHRLKVAVTTPKTEYAPGDELDADVAVTDREGHGARAAVTFYAVDEGVLMLTSYQTPDPLPPFTADQKLAVFSVESREALARILPLKNGERIKPLGYEFAENAKDDKGGDGGGGGADGVRADFKTTAFFDATQVTSNEGRAHYRFKLPDNLTTFRLMAVVAGEDRFGKGEASVTTSRKLMARPALPRIVRAGDAFEAGVIVSSKGLDATTAEVSLSVAGDAGAATTAIRPTGPTSRRVQVPKGGSVEVRFPVRAETPGKGTFEFAVAGAGEKDRVRVERTVDLPVDVETTSVYGETTRAAAVGLGDLSRTRRDQGGLEVHLASTALVGLKTSFDRAIEYPYGCSEQLASRILPLLALPEMARAFGARMPAKIEDVVDAGIGDLLDHQQGSGGYGYWQVDAAASPVSDAPVPWLSAYATLTVEMAAQKGYFVPRGARDRGVEYLRQLLDQTRIAAAGARGEEEENDERAEPGQADPDAEKPERAYASLAFVADVLATIGQPDPGYLNRLYDARAHRPLFTQALLLHAMAVAKMPREQLDRLLQEIESRVRVDGGAAYVDDVDAIYADFLDSSSRTAALVLRAVVAARPADPLAPRLARGLLDRRENGAWRSTQENVWALLALNDYRRVAEATAPSFDARVFVGSDRLGEAPFHGASTADAPFFLEASRLPATGGTVTFDVSGQGKLYYSAELRTASAELPDRPLDRGLFVQKRLRALRPAELPAAERVVPKKTESSAPAGDLVLIDLLLESPEPREQVVVEDPLPAGLEPIDFALDTAAQSEAAEPQPDPADAEHARRDYGAFREAEGVHREAHDDKVLTFLPHLDPGIYHFRYLARATTPGDFVVPPARAQGMYAPEVQGRTAASRFVVVGSSGPKAKP